LAPLNVVMIGGVGIAARGADFYFVGAGRLGRGVLMTSWIFLVLEQVNRIGRPSASLENALNIQPAFSRTAAVPSVAISSNPNRRTVLPLLPPAFCARR